MKRKNSALTTLYHQWDTFKREAAALFMKLFVVAWVVGMSGFAIFILMTMFTGLE